MAVEVAIAFKCITSGLDQLLVTTTPTTSPPCAGFTITSSFTIAETNSTQPAHHNADDSSETTEGHPDPAIGSNETRLEQNAPGCTSHGGSTLR